MVFIDILQSCTPFISEFTKDKSVSRVTQKLIRTKNRRLICFWPNKDAEKKNKDEVDLPADPENSNEWTMYECRLLMHGGDLIFHFPDEIFSKANFSLYRNI